MTAPDGFSIDPGELVFSAERADAIREGLLRTVWEDERVGDGWLDHGAQAGDDQLSAAMATYLRSLRAVTQRLANRAEQLGVGLRDSAYAYSDIDQRNVETLSLPDPHDE